MNAVLPHPLMPAPSLEVIEAEQQRHGGTTVQAAERLLARRREAMRAEQGDPLRFGWEPDVWKVCDALLDWPWLEDEAFKGRLERAGTSWDAWKEVVRRNLGFREVVRMLLVLGGQRSAKSTYAAKRSVQMLMRKERARVFPMHMESKRSVAEQQPLFWQFLPPEERVPGATEERYVKYKVKTGFSEMSFILTNLSFCQFKFYSQSMNDTLQGIEPDLVAPDELLPYTWVREIEQRLNTRAGRCICTFTPVEGFSATVALWMAGAEVARDAPAWLVPLDGGARDEGRALGLSEEELREVWRAHEEKGRAARAPQARSEDCLGWGLESGAAGKAEEVAGRRFARMPRVMRCVDPRYGVVLFWSSDNPYGNPKEVAASLRKKPVDGLLGVKERFYGWADKVAAGKFPKFDRKVHVVAPRRVPGAEAGRTVMVCDPAKGRNFYMLWARIVGETVWCVREWPGRSWVPGIGVPGPWATPSGLRGDGEKGPGQGPWGFGLLRYKAEIARLEGWEAWRRWRRDLGARWSDDATPPLRLVEEWDEPVEGGEAEEILELRWLDSRAATEPRIERDRPVTLQSDLERIGLRFGLATGVEIADGVQRVNNALDWEEGWDPLVAGAENRGDGAPKLFVSEDCPNLIFALEYWKLEDGERGATKDPIDAIRYVFDSGVVEERPAVRARGGMAYGTAPGRRGGREEREEEEEWWRETRR